VRVGESIHPTLRAADREEHLSVAGYQSLTVLEPSAAEALRSEMTRLYTGERSGFHSSVESTDLAYRRRVHERVIAALGEVIERDFADHQVINTALVVKWPGEDGVVPIHQDWTFVDETRFRSVNLYCALTPSDSSNGGLRVLPGSHLVAARVRCGRGWPQWYVDPAGALRPEDLDPLTFAVGEGAVLDNALLHCSMPNRTSEPRISVVVALAPREADLRHAYRRSDHEIDVYAVPDARFFLGHLPGAEPSGLDLLETIPMEAPRFDEEDLRRLATPHGRVGVHTPPTVAAGAPPAPRSLRARLADLLRRQRQPAATPTFTDSRTDEQFRRDGFVVVDLLDAEAAASLRRAFDGLDHRLTWDSPFADGFHTSIFDQRGDYRARVLSLLDEHLGVPLGGVLDDHAIFFANFTVKSAGGGPVPTHLDWTFVDEDRFRSATVWCALGDITTADGALGVVPGSHETIDFIRAVNRRDYEAHEALRSRDGTVVELRVGQAIIMDNRCLHYSPPNRGDRLRVAATCVVAPRSADLHHYWVDDDDQLWQFRVSRDFYLDYTPGMDPADAAGVLGRVALNGVRYG
jgi:ectoine hydroxylase-related dioxygenase (phytanoyl-CoA dioxygenase family)